MSVIAIPDRIRRSHRAGSASRVVATWGAGLIALVLLFACTAPALAAPVLDGNIDDVVAQANTYISNGTGCGIVINDPAKDVCLSDPLIVPCTNSISTCINTGQYYVNGFDQILAVGAVQGTDAWWGIRVNGGQIGDSDGDGTDGKGAACPPPGLGQNPEDQPGISEGERYIIRLDTNCDGNTDIRITVLSQAGGQANHPSVIITDGGGITPIPGASGTAQYGTTDLEIHTTGLVLPAVFSLNTFVGSDFDGLSEDAAGPKLCNPPNLKLAIQKTVEKPTICPGDKDRFTVTVTNNSAVDVVTNVRDILPAGWVYADNISGDFAFNSQNGQVVSFGPLSVPAGGSKSVSFDVTSPSDCLGPYENKAVADGAFTSPCLTEPVTALTDTARATVSCDTKPCVTNARCTAPETACSNDQIQLKFFATNCGDRASSIVFTFGGHQHIVNNVAAGAEAEFDTTIAFVCTQGEPTVYSFSAVSQNSCGTSAPANSNCSTTCASPPCASVTCAAPTDASSGDNIQLSAIAHNCGDHAADIQVCIYRAGSLVGCHWLRGVPANTDARFDTTVSFQCEPGSDTNFSATASAVNSCGTSQTANSPSPCPVHCRQVGGSCPRTVGYWGAQCAQKGNGSTKFTVAQVTAIASCIDSRVDVFSWSDKFAGFCAIINPDRPMNCKKQALRQFAGLLANACVGQLGFKASNGDSIFLTLSDPNPCKSAFPNAQTLGDLIDAIDDALVALQNANADPQDPGYCAIVECADGINNGRGIPIAPGCGETTSSPTRLGGNGELQTDASGLDVNGSSTQILELYRPTPNPFSNTTSFAYQVSGSASQRVQIGIYNVAGRLIRELVNESKAPGRYQTVWNGQDQGGASVTHGVYFIRAYVGGVRVSDASRILYLR